MKHILRKFLIIITLFIASIIIYNLIQERISLSNVKDDFETFSLLSNAKGEYKNFNNQLNDNVKITNYNGDLHLPLKEYSIKSSFNSAVSGSFVSIDMIKLLLSRGCRFLDFEIFIIDDIPHISYTTDSSYTTRDTDNTILLFDALSSISANAFVQDIPNPKDPLFIHLRVKSDDPKSLKLIAACIDATIYKSGKLYSDKINDNTTLNDIMGQVLFLIDNTTLSNYNSLTKCSINEVGCFNIDNYINAKSNNLFYSKKKIIDIIDSENNNPSVNPDSGLTDNIKRITIALPETNPNSPIFSNSNINNPDIRDLIYNHSTQIVGFKYYNIDDEFIEYENFFDFFKSAFVPFKRSMPYLNRYYQ
jgi:hypothetical protein